MTQLSACLVCAGPLRRPWEALWLPADRPWAEWRDLLSLWALRASRPSPPTPSSPRAPLTSDGLRSGEPALAEPRDNDAPHLRGETHPGPSAERSRRSKLKPLTGDEKEPLETMKQCELLGVSEVEAGF